MAWGRFGEEAMGPRGKTRKGPQLGPFRIGILVALLFDVLIEIPKSSEGVCFFFLPKPGFGCGLGNQVGGGRLRAMMYSKSYRTHNIGEKAEVCVVAMGLVEWLGAWG